MPTLEVACGSRGEGLGPTLVGGCKDPGAASEIVEAAVGDGSLIGGEDLRGSSLFEERPKIAFAAFMAFFFIIGSAKIATVTLLKDFQ